MIFSRFSVDFRKMYLIYTRIATAINVNHKGKANFPIVKISLQNTNVSINTFWTSLQITVYFYFYGAEPSHQYETIWARGDDTYWWNNIVARSQNI